MLMKPIIHRASFYLHHHNNRIQTVRFYFSLSVISLNNNIRVLPLTPKPSLQQMQQLGSFVKQHSASSDSIFVVDEDCSYNMGMNRQFAYQYLKINKLKGIQEPQDPFFNSNPDVPLLPQETIFDPAVFLRTDQQFDQQSWKKSRTIVLKKYSEKQTQLVQRLIENYQFRVGARGYPLAMHALFMASVRNFTLSMGGLSNLFIRETIMREVDLAGVKIAFMQFLKKDTSETQKIGRLFLLSFFEQILRTKSILQLYTLAYSLPERKKLLIRAQPSEKQSHISLTQNDQNKVHQQHKTLNQQTENNQSLQRITGRRRSMQNLSSKKYGQKLLKQTIIVTEPANLQMLQNIAKNQTVADVSQLRDIKNIRSVVFAEKKIAEDNDQTMLEKSAILDVILKDQAWTMPFIKNRYPYLSEDFNKMSADEKESVNQRYLYHLNRYLSAQKRFKDS